MALNLGGPLQYPNIQAKGVMDSFTQTVAPYMAMDAAMFKRQQDQQNMALKQSEEGRAQARFGREQQDWEKNDQLVSQLQGAAAAAKGDPVQTLLNLHKVAMVSGNMKLMGDVRKLTDDAVTQMNPEQAAMVQNALGINTSKEIIEGQRTKYQGDLMIDPYGVAKISPAAEFRETLQDKRTASSEKIATERMMLQERLASIRQSNADRNANLRMDKASESQDYSTGRAALTDADSALKSAMKMEDYATKLEMMPPGQGFNSLLMSMMGDRVITPDMQNSVSSDPKGFAQYLRTRAAEQKDTVRSVVDELQASDRPGFKRALVSKPMIVRWYESQAPAPVQPGAAPGGQVVPPPPQAFAPGSKEAIQAKLRKAGATAPPSSPGITLSEEEKRLMQEDLYHMGKGSR